MRVKLGKNKIKKANENAQRVIEIKHQMSATGEAEAEARTKAQNSCHIQRSSAKMAATWLTSCKRAKGIREAAARGKGGERSVSVCVSKFLAKMKSMQAPRHATLCRRQLPRQMKSSRIQCARAGTTKYEEEDEDEDVDEDEAEAEHDGRGLCAQIQFTCVRVTGQGNQKRAGRTPDGQAGPAEGSQTRICNMSLGYLYANRHNALKSICGRASSSASSRQRSCSWLSRRALQPHLLLPVDSHVQRRNEMKNSAKTSSTRQGMGGTLKQCLACSVKREKISDMPIKRIDARVAENSKSYGNNTHYGISYHIILF